MKIRGAANLFMKTMISNLLRCGVLMLSLMFGLPAVNAAQFGEGFSTPTEASAALARAAGARDVATLRTILGPDAEDLENPDRVQATNELAAFAAAFNETNRVVQESDTQYELEIGSDAWPFPVPIVSRKGKWFFDTAAGKQEILNRRIGRNELDVLKTMRAYLDAQREYASKDRDGDQVLKYAQRLASTPGKKDGLYWSEDLDGEVSPLGPTVADAQTEGYTVRSEGQEATRAPFHGYYFKILTRQGKSAPGGEYNYIINGNMIGGCALVAYPAAYGDSGIMTFIVNQQGRVYQKNLGPDTVDIASKMTAYDPDNTWRISPD